MIVFLLPCNCEHITLASQDHGECGHNFFADTLCAVINVGFYDNQPLAVSYLR